MKSSIFLLAIAAFAFQAAQAAFIINFLDKIHTALSQPKASADGWPITNLNGTELSYTVKSKGDRTARYIYVRKTEADMVSRTYV